MRTAISILLSVLAAAVSPGCGGGHTCDRGLSNREAYPSWSTFQACREGRVSKGTDVTLVGQVISRGSDWLRLGPVTKEDEMFLGGALWTADVHFRRELADEDAPEGCRVVVRGRYNETSKLLTEVDVVDAELLPWDFPLGHRDGVEPSVAAR